MITSSTHLGQDATCCVPLQRSRSHTPSSACTVEEAGWRQSRRTGYLHQRTDTSTSSRNTATDYYQPQASTAHIVTKAGPSTRSDSSLHFSSRTYVNSEPFERTDRAALDDGIRQDREHSYSAYRRLHRIHNNNHPHSLQPTPFSKDNPACPLF